MFHRLSFVVLTLFVFLASLVRASDFPSCAQPCVGQASGGSCSMTDNTCLCQNSSYCNATNNCFHSSCSLNDWRTAYNTAVAMCNQAGVTQNNIINPPPPKRDFIPVYFGYVATSSLISLQC
ncbi:hypothetical protein FS749_009787 [Ceratobasidium sp. UAMH 11750]|nr:hypothetical protein FS749_009787 [Ceratobasidium sp. UAMH 11750]